MCYKFSTLRCLKFVSTPVLLFVQYVWLIFVTLVMLVGLGIGKLFRRSSIYIAGAIRYMSAGE